MLASSPIVAVDFMATSRQVQRSAARMTSGTLAHPAQAWRRNPYPYPLPPRRDEASRVEGLEPVPAQIDAEPTPHPPAPMCSMSSRWGFFFCAWSGARSGATCAPGSLVPWLMPAAAGRGPENGRLPAGETDRPRQRRAHASTREAHRQPGEQHARLSVSRDAALPPDENQTGSRIDGGRAGAGAGIRKRRRSIV
jgi:hypothetical protein